MKKYAYILAAASVIIGSLGFASIYNSSQSEIKNDFTQNQQVVEEDKIPEDKTDQLADEEDTQAEDQNEDVASKEEDSTDAQVGTITEEALHFDLDGDIRWPIEGTVLLDYSMDSTIYFPTLAQYKYNPAMVLAGDVNSKVYFIARGKITNIETNEETGCTVTQDLGDGYTAVYGQLKELNFKVGDTVEAGQVVGYISEPTKYYSTEGSNLYFEMRKDGNPVDPAEILP